MLNSLIMKHGWYSPNSYTFNVVAIATVMVPCLVFVFFTLCDVTTDLTGVLLGHQRFFVNNFRSNWYRESRKAGTIGMVISSRIDWCKFWLLLSLAQAMALGAWADFYLGVQPCYHFKSTSRLPFQAASQEYYDGVRISALRPLLADLLVKSQNTTFWITDLTAEVTGWPETLNVGTCL